MVEYGRRVKVHYIGSLDDGTEFENTYKNGIPLEYIVGKHQVVPGFERAVLEMVVGEKKDLHISVEEAYGRYDEGLIESVPTDSIPDADKLPVGEYVVFSTPGGSVRVKILKIEAGHVHFDHNHELAGRNLNFSVELVEIVGDYSSSIEKEKHPSGCGCGCDEMKKALLQE